MAEKLSAVIITFNEEKNIARCLDSLEGVVDEIVVVDSFSKDNTKQICLDRGARFIENPFEGHIEQKNFAMMRAENDYVLSLDADEALSENLKKSILEAKKNLNHDAYTFNRLTNYCGQWIKHCGWYPDRKLRIWNKTKGKWGGENPHDMVLMENGTSSQYLKGDLLHYSYYTINDHSRQIELFTDISSKAAFAKGKRTNKLAIVFKPAFKFFRDYIFKLGILDGYYGFVISVNSAHAKFLKYHKIYELKRKQKAES
ncbi:MAG: glycosyltransferase family 2 protein [Flavobacteriales bacterium]|nr:glycosyltransferase family 2 protein [Flavobacteriales bacterium]